ncbi:MAG: 4-hydroxybenzoate transporter [Mucilaginibacter sp.]|nr:4-hydroxybenzoate transporter [Mucilaginibacter sp.]
MSHFSPDTPGASNPVTELIDRTPFGRFHLHLLIMVAIAQALEGFEMQLIGYTAPAMAETMHVSKFTFGWLFAANNFGFMIGALLLSSLGDRIGRKKMIVLGAMLFGIFTLIIGYSSSFNEVLIFRLIAGIGLGGAVPNIIAITAEYAPAHRRATALSTLFVAYTLGSAISGFGASYLLKSHSWQLLFQIGGWSGLALAVLMAWRLPESIRFMAKNKQVDRVNGVLRNFDPNFTWDGKTAVTEPPPTGSPLTLLFSEGRARTTIALWLAIICSMVSLHLLTSWLPTLIHQFGIATSIAVLIGSMFHVGGSTANLALGRMIDRFGPRVVAVTLLIAAPVVAILGSAADSVVMLGVLVGLTGFFVAGGQNGLNALSGLLYPERIRATGSGWAYGVGRIGSVIGPVIGGALISLHLSNNVLFSIIGLPLVGAAFCVLWLRGNAVHKRHGPLPLENASNSNHAAPLFKEKTSL